MEWQRALLGCGLSKSRGPKEGSYGSSCKCGLDLAAAWARLRACRRGGDDHGRGACCRLFPADGLQVGQPAQTRRVASRSLESAAPLTATHAGRCRAGDPAYPRRTARGAARDRAGALGIAASTVHAVLRRHGRSRLQSRPERETIVPYERSPPGELMHVDIKKLGRTLEPGHRVTGDRRGQAKSKGRLAVRVRRDRRPLPTRLRLRLPRRDDRLRARLPRGTRPLLRLPRHPHRARAYRQQRLLQTPLGRGLRKARGVVKKTRAYRPQTNGKAERFIRTLLERWAYAYPYQHEHERLAALPSALDFYSHFRPHRALAGLTPLQRVNNLPGTYN